jgi:hypothetical protein
MSGELHALATLLLVKELIIAIVDTLLGGWASGLVAYVISLSSGPWSAYPQQIP